MKSRKTLARRVKALKLAKAISLVVERSGHGTVSTWELLIPSQQAAAAARERFMPPPEAVIELLVDPVTRRKQLDRILAEDGSATDWRAYAAGGGANEGDDATADNRREDDGEEASLTEKERRKAFSYCALLRSLSGNVGTIGTIGDYRGLSGRPSRGPSGEGPVSGGPLAVTPFRSLQSTQHLQQETVFIIFPQSP